MAENKRQDSEPLWKFAEARGISRRHFLRLMAVGGAAAVLAACAIPETPDATQPLPPPPADSLESVAPARFKDPARLSSCTTIRAWRPALRICRA